jgi:hypothetical protein
MKKIFFFTFSLLVTAFAYQGCTPVDNTKAWAKADSDANSRLVLLGDSLRVACMNDVMAAATLRADTMMQFAMKKPGAKPPTKAKPAPPPANTGKLSDKLGEDKGKLKDQMGAGKDTTKKQGKLKDQLGVPKAPPK